MDMSLLDSESVLEQLLETDFSTDSAVSDEPAQTDYSELLSEVQQIKEAIILQNSDFAGYTMSDYFGLLEVSIVIGFCLCLVPRLVAIALRGAIKILRKGTS